MRTQGPANLSTYAILALSDWPLPAKLIYQHSTPIEVIAKGNFELPKTFLLSAAQINEALSGPYQGFLKDKLIAYAALNRVKSKLIITQQDFFKNDSPTAAANKDNALPANLVNSFTLPALQTLLTQLEQLTQEHYQQWLDAVNYWKNGIAQYLNQSNVNLAEIETKEFFDDETATDLVNRFSDLQITLPKLKNGCYCFGVYLKLKTIIAVNTSLSRRLQAHGDAEINQIINPLQSYFNDVEKYEKQMLENQHQATMQAINSVAFAVSNLT